jgi:hypothetical protein
MRRLEQLEDSMAPPDDQPKLEIGLVFVEPVDGLPGGRITRIVRLSELARKSGGDEQ